MAHLDTRRRTLAQKGRPMALSRPNGSSPADAVTVQGFLYPYAPDRIAGPIRQGDANVAVLNDELAAAAWPAPPRAGDRMLIDGATWVVQGANPIYEGATLIGFNIWVRGGQP